MTPTPYYQNWVSQVERYPFILDPQRTPGTRLANQLAPDLRQRLDRLRVSLAMVLGICSCKISQGLSIAIEPDKAAAPFSISDGYKQAVIDLQTGHLYVTTEPLSLIKPYHPEWQYFLQFTLSS